MLTALGTLSKKASGELRGRRGVWVECRVQALGRAVACELTGSTGQGFIAAVSGNTSKLCAGRWERSRKRKALVLVLVESADPSVLVRPLLPLLLLLLLPLLLRLPLPEAPCALLSAWSTIRGSERIPFAINAATPAAFPDRLYQRPP